MNYMTKCPNCGAPMQGNTCIYCHYEKTNNQTNASTPNDNVQGGNVIINNVYNQTPNSNIVYVRGISPKSKIVALLLCIFLGVFGAHQFYVGKVGKGILYIFTCGLFGIGWFIDIILILCGSFKDSNDLPLKK